MSAAFWRAMPPAVVALALIAETLWAIRPGQIWPPVVLCGVGLVWLVITVRDR